MEKAIERQLSPAKTFSRVNEAYKKGRGQRTVMCGKKYFIRFSPLERRFAFSLIIQSPIRRRSTSSKNFFPTVENMYLCHLLILMHIGFPKGYTLLMQSIQVEEPVSPVRPSSSGGTPRTIHPFPRCLEPASSSSH